MLPPNGCFKAPSPSQPFSCGIAVLRGSPPPLTEGGGQSGRSRVLSRRGRPGARGSKEGGVTNDYTEDNPLPSNQGGAERETSPRGDSRGTGAAGGSRGRNRGWQNRGSPTTPAAWCRAASAPLPAPSPQAPMLAQGCFPPPPPTPRSGPGEPLPVAARRGHAPLAAAPSFAPCAQRPAATPSRWGAGGHSPAASPCWFCCGFFHHIWLFPANSRLGRVAGVGGWGT